LAKSKIHKEKKMIILKDAVDQLMTEILGSNILSLTKGNRGATLLLASRCEELAIPIPDTIGKTSFTAKERDSTLNRIRQFLEEKKDDLRTLLEFHVKIKEKAVISEYKEIVSRSYYSEGTSYLDYKLLLDSGIYVFFNESGELRTGSTTCSWGGNGTEFGIEQIQGFLSEISAELGRLEPEKIKTAFEKMASLKKDEIEYTKLKEKIISSCSR
jgi:hypothetical protein